MSRQGLGLSVVPAYPGLGGSSPQKQQKKEDLSFALTMQQHCACPYSIPVPGQVMHIQGVYIREGQRPGGMWAMGTTEGENQGGAWTDRPSPDLSASRGWRRAGRGLQL